MNENTAEYGRKNGGKKGRREYSEKRGKAISDDSASIRQAKRWRRRKRTTKQDEKKAKNGEEKQRRKKGGVVERGEGSQGGRFAPKGRESFRILYEKKYCKREKRKIEKGNNDANQKGEQWPKKEMRSQAAKHAQKHAGRAICGQKGKKRLERI